MIGAAAIKLRKLLDLNYESTNDYLGRTFCGLHDTVLPQCSKAQSVFQQLCNCIIDITKNGRRTKQRTDDAAPGPQINGRPNGRVTRVDQRHLLLSLLLPFLLLDLLHDEVQEFNGKEGSHHVSTASKPMILVLAVLVCARVVLSILVTRKHTG